MKNSVFVFLTMLLISSCSSKNENLVTENEVIAQYHQTYFNHAPRPAANDVAIYIDFSTGMKTAFSNKANAEFYDLFINSLKISSVSFFEVADYSVNEMKNFNTSELYKLVKDASKFSKINAPLNKALSDIVAANRQAVFITDGELWEDQERDDPWAREEFAKWLKAGNSIVFYVTDFEELGKQKHVFFMFFIPKESVSDKENMASVFEFYIKNSQQAKQIPYTRFAFATNSYKPVREYPTETSGGANPSLEIDQATFVDGSKDNFEFHEYYLGWKDMVEYIRSATDDNGNPLQGGEPLIQKQFLEIGDLEFYTIEELDIKVYDVKDDVDRLLLCRECMENKPVFELNEKGEKVLDADNNPILVEQGNSQCYNEIGELVMDTVYKPLPQLKEVQEVFSFDTNAFMNNYREQGRGEYIIKLHPNFNGSQVNVNDYNLHRIDVYLKKVSEKTDNPNLTKFIWNGIQVPQNRSMYNSILGALHDANPTGNVIYSYYVKTLPNDFK